ncbi:calcium-dependent protein kinase [Sinorhizobium medicae]|uniref:nuclear transport factor 2 family protein n=1 Tax=Sinorhizobium medicae TaxID=110321 RepID=UPI001AADAE9F|nr:nuclear transport factor 2 family protein [Sinorhizobium medicae]MBO1944574.1 nuclear transport factor 2 family protein [Sinorhizobium medicae]MDX0871120.1 calcium-dependent protein kinase [Sinorhizobium medicae]MDX0888966.1 calcium-dependent protein kinase [Sinorhizobium medicae]MDX0895029.1 calcium-dependent protein kinase [Sinorhizobium medicae]
MARARKIDPSLRESIDKADKFWQEGNKEWFELLTDDVVVYAVASAEPFEGRKAYEEYFGPRLTGGTRVAKPITRDIQMLQDDNAVVAQTLQVKEDEVIANIRQSVIWRKVSADDGWKIQHLHTTIIGRPTAADAKGFAKAAPSGIRVLNEKIATISAVLGVAQ